MRFDALEAPERIDAQNRRQIAKHQVNVYHGGPQAGAGRTGGHCRHQRRLTRAALTRYDRDYWCTGTAVIGHFPLTHASDNISQIDDIPGLLRNVADAGNGIPIRLIQRIPRLRTPRGDFIAPISHGHEWIIRHQVIAFGRDRATRRDFRSDIHVRRFRILTVRVRASGQRRVRRDDLLCTGIEEL